LSTLVAIPDEVIILLEEESSTVTLVRSYTWVDFRKLYGMPLSMLDGSKIYEQ
jgi:hypothetical protein